MSAQEDGSRGLTYESGQQGHSAQVHLPQPLAQRSGRPAGFAGEGRALQDGPAFALNMEGAL